jgi:hypothetical protein
MPKYFHISHGLRGCYMPDAIFVLKAATRRDLKAALAFDANDISDAGFHLNKRHVASVAAAAWREAHKARPSIYDFVIPYGNDHAGDRPFAIAASVATRADYQAYQDENE